MPEDRVVPYKDDTLDVRLVVTQATGRLGMYRSLLRDQAAADIVKDRPLYDPTPETVEDVTKDDLLVASDEILHLHFYPCMIAATIEHAGFDTWPISYERYANLPEPLLIEWEFAVFSLNPHWKLRANLEKAPDLKKSSKGRRSKSTSVSKPTSKRMVAINT